MTWHVEHPRDAPAAASEDACVDHSKQSVPWAVERLRQSIQRRPLLSKLVGNIGWLLFERAFVLLTGFFVNIWFVKYLGPESFGSYSYAVSLATLFVAMAALGTDTVIVRNLALDALSDGGILGTALGVRLIAGIIGWMAAVVAVISLQADSVSRVLVAIIGANALCTSIGVFEFWFQARIIARPLVIGRTAVALVSQAGRVLMILAGATLTSFAWLFVATSAAMSGVAYALYLRYRGARVRLTFDGNRARALLRDSWPMGIAGLAIMVYVKIDQVMLGQMTSRQETGLYAAAAALSEVWYFIPIAIATTVFPFILGPVAGDTAERDRRLQRFYDAMAAISFVIAGVTTLFARPLVVGLYGPAYSRAAEMLVVHVWSLPFVSLGTARARLLVAENMTVFAMISAVLGGIANIALNLYLIPLYGGLGAAWATLVSYAFAGYASSALSRRAWSQLAMQTRALFVFLRPAVLTGSVSKGDELHGRE